MQTRRDQLQAYKFQNRRALAALVSGQPNAVDPPMRRLTIMTMSGIMIAVLVTVGFAVFGLIRPSAGDSWKEAGAIIVESNTGATYVRLKGVLRPVTNYTSAVLAVGKNSPHTVTVEKGDIAGAPRGTRIGIPDLPASLPSADDLVGDPVSVCSRQSADNDSLVAKVDVVFGGDAKSRRLGDATGVVVRGGPNNATWLLADGHRLQIASTDVANGSLGLAKVKPLVVGTAFLNGVPLGAVLKPPQLDGVGQPSPKVSVDGKPVAIGRLLKVSGNTYVALSDGVAQVDSVQAALLESLPTGSGGEALPALTAPASTPANSGTSRAWDAIEKQQLNGLPTEIPTPDTSAARNGGVCAVYRDGSERPEFAVPPTRVPSTVSGDDVTATNRGLADDVVIAPGRAALVRSIDAKTTFLVADPGRRFAIPNSDVRTALGYGKATSVSIPAQLLPLVPPGPALDPQAALRPVSS